MNCAEELFMAMKIVDVTIRQVERAFLPQICEIENLSFSHPYPPWYISHLVGADRESFFVAMSYDRVLGYVVASILGESVHLVSIAVHPQHRGKGVATALMEKMMESLKSKNVKLITLEVGKRNIEARGLYRKLGFKVTGTREAYYENGEDAIVFSKAVT